MVLYKVLNDLNEDIKHFRKAIFVDELGFNFSDEFDNDETKYIHCCLYENNKLIAYARVAIDADNVRIGRVLVLKDKRKQGFGKQIMFRAEVEAMKHKRIAVEVHALDQAVGFYEKLGYEQDGDWFIEDGRNHIKMVKRLEEI